MILPIINIHLKDLEKKYRNGCCI